MKDLNISPSNFYEKSVQMSIPAILYMQKFFETCEHYGVPPNDLAFELYKSGEFCPQTLAGLECDLNGTYR